MNLKKFLAVFIPVVAIVGLILFILQYNTRIWEKSPDDPVALAELDQGWNETTRSFWYGASQGSRLIPLDWLEALEAPSSTGLFMAPKHIEKFKFIPRRVKLPNRKGYAQLAVGFVADDTSDEDLKRTRLRWKKNQTDTEYWAGLNCSACHTSKIAYKGKTIRVEGGASLFEFQLFMEKINEALQQTYDDKEKWNRFEARVLSGDLLNDENKGLLRGEFKKLLDWQILEASANISKVKYGYGRIDAFGRIYNKVALLVEAKDQTFNPPDAPVSVPFIWSAPQYTRVQYNGVAPRILLWGVDVGALARNTGEVIGTFGDVVVEKNLNVHGFRSSINIKNLYTLEENLRALRSPKWPASVFGPITEEEKKQEAKLAKKGRELYDKKCVVCHDIVDRADTKQILHVQDNLLLGESNVTNERAKYLPEDVKSQTIYETGTDPWMACNSYLDRAKTGVWSSDAPKEVDYESIGNAENLQLGQTADVSKLLTITVAGVLAANKKNVAELIGTSFLNEPQIPEGLVPDIGEGPIIDTRGSFSNHMRPTDKSERLERCGKAAVEFAMMKAKNNILGYTSRPLNGIWATAPYLHNGSVPTLYDLLLPQEERPKSFFLGTHEYDPIKVGYRTEPGPGNKFLFEAKKDDGNGREHLVDGNTNEGHDYDNAKFTHADRMALIAYMKTL